MSDGPGSARRFPFAFYSAQHRHRYKRPTLSCFISVKCPCQHCVGIFTHTRHALPPVRRIELQIALHAARPLIAEAAGAHCKELRAKIPISPDSGSLYANGLCALLRHYLHGIVVLSSEYTLFSGLGYMTLQCPRENMMRNSLNPL